MSGRRILYTIFWLLVGASLARAEPSLRVGTCLQELERRDRLNSDFDRMTYRESATFGQPLVRFFFETPHRKDEDYDIYLIECRVGDSGEVVLGETRLLFSHLPWHDFPEHVFTCFDRFEAAGQRAADYARMRVRDTLARGREWVLFFFDTAHARGEDYRTYLHGCRVDNRNQVMVSEGRELYPRVSGRGEAGRP